MAELPDGRGGVHELAKAMRLHRPGDRKSLELTIEHMLADGELRRHGRQFAATGRKQSFVGTLSLHPDGFGFVIPEDGSADLVLSAREMHTVLHGDTVMVRVAGMDRRGRREAKIVEVLESANQRVVGRLYEDHGILFVVAENRRISQDILIAPGGAGNATAGQVVVLESMQQPSKHAQPIGRVVEVLGNYADPGMEIEIARRKHDLPYEFPKDAERQAKKFAPEVAADDYAGREDVRQLPLVTIDPAFAGFGVKGLW